MDSDRSTFRRRDVIRRLGAVGGTAVAATGLGAAEPSAADVRLRWEFPDGHAEELSLAAFDRRDDTPSRAELRDRGTSVWASVCCDCPLRGPDCEECADGCGSDTLQSATL